MSKNGMQAVAAAIRALPIEQLPSGSQAGAIPFVTISRQVGAGGGTFGQMLVDELNRRNNEELKWTYYDKLLVEKVAADHNLSKHLVASLEEEPTYLLNDLVIGLTHTATAELIVFRRTAATIRALARHGRSVILGRGGAYLTQDIVGGVHLQLIAPIQDRIDNIQAFVGLSADKAAAYVNQHDNAREEFLRRYFSKNRRSPLAFHATFNTEKLTGDQMLEATLALLPNR